MSDINLFAGYPAWFFAVMYPIVVLPFGLGALVVGALLGTVPAFIVTVQNDPILCEDVL